MLSCNQYCIVFITKGVKIMTTRSRIFIGIVLSKKPANFSNGRAKQSKKVSMQAFMNVTVTSQRKSCLMYDPLRIRLCLVSLYWPVVKESATSGLVHHVTSLSSNLRVQNSSNTPSVVSTMIWSQYHSHSSALSLSRLSCIEARSMQIPMFRTCSQPDPMNCFEESSANWHHVRSLPSKTFFQISVPTAATKSNSCNTTP
mmetsp:Transcript_52817/g.123550  ORF Transcript_52817/g.123550 Transcript_52817/m.123550 type:complete len:200 (+) Transcript_52817:260-859(+)